MAKRNAEINGEIMKFVPPSLTVKAEDTVCWVNNDARPHTVTFDKDDPDAVDIPPDSAQIAPGDSFEAEFPTAGSFPYHCENHPVMKGTVTVT